MIKKVKLSKFNGEACENLYTDIRYINTSNFNDLANLFNKVSNAMENKAWLKSRDDLYLMDVLDKGGFIIGCYIEDTLIASALCELPDGDYLDYLYEIGFSDEEINSSYISGYVMVDPLYRGNSLHKTLLETRIEESILRGKTNIVTAIAEENIFSLNTVLNLGFEIKLQKQNEHGVKRNVLLKKLINVSTSNMEVTA